MPDSTIYFSSGPKHFLTRSFCFQSIHPQISRQHSIYWVADDYLFSSDPLLSLFLIWPLKKIQNADFPKISVKKQKPSWTKLKNFWSVHEKRIPKTIYCFLFWTLISHSCKGRCHLRFSWIRPLRGYPPPPPLTENQSEKKKVFFLSGKGGYPPP